MALRRTFSLRSLFSARYYKPSFSGIILRDNDHEEKLNYGSFLHQRSFSSSILSQHLRSSSHLSLCTPFGVSICRSMSTSHVPGSDDSVNNVNDVAGTPIYSVIENVVSQVPSDCSFAFDIFQRLIETVHSFTGLNWWASIVLTTFWIRGVTIPLMIDNEKWRSRLWMRGIHSTASMEITDPATLAEHEIEFFKLLKKYGGISFLSIIVYPLQMPVSVWMGLAINDMSEKVASFKTGGALWFTDLTTPDALIFPFLTRLTFCIMVECDALLGLEGAMMPKRLTRIAVIPMFVSVISLSKAVHCYLMSCMLFSIAFTLVIRRPGVRKYFDIPEVPEHVPLILYKRVFSGKWFGKWF